MRHTQNKVTQKNQKKRKGKNGKDMLVNGNTEKAEVLVLTTDKV